MQTNMAAAAPTAPDPTASGVPTLPSAAPPPAAAQPGTPTLPTTAQPTAAQPGVPTLPAAAPPAHAPAGVPPHPAGSPHPAGVHGHGATGLPGAATMYGSDGSIAATRHVTKRRTTSGAVIGTLLLAIIVAALGASARFGWNMWQTRDSIGALGDGTLPAVGSLPTDPYDRPSGRYLDVTTVWRSGDHVEVERIQRDLTTGDFVRDDWLGHEQLPNFSLRVEDGVAASLDQLRRGEAIWLPYEYPTERPDSAMTSSLLMFQDVLTPEVRPHVRVIDERDEIVVLPTVEPVERLVVDTGMPNARINLASDRTVKTRRYDLSFDGQQFATDDPFGYAAYTGFFPVEETFTIWMDASGAVRKLEFPVEDRDGSRTVIFSDLTNTPPGTSSEGEVD